MARFEASIDVPADARTVFDLVHDYDRRLEWATLLSEARLLEGATEAGPGVLSVCVGKSRLLRLAVESRYITFEPPRTAAVSMTQGPWIFARFAASLRHEDTGPGHSRVTYVGDIVTRPALLRPLIEPIVAAKFRRETRARLEGLRRFLSAESAPVKAG